MSLHSDTSAIAAILGRQQRWLSLLALTITLAVAFLALKAGTDGKNALLLGAACGICVMLIPHPFSAYLTLIFIGLLADYKQWQFTAWTHDLGRYVYENWGKQLSPEETNSWPSWLIVNTIDVLIIVTILGCVITLRNTLSFRLNSPLVPLTVSYGIVIGIMFAYGVMTGGDIDVALWQVRPFFHFVAIAFLGTLLIHSRARIISLVWIISVVVLFKALQVIGLFFTEAGATFGEWRELLGHEDSVFFAGLIGLVTAYGFYGLRHNQIDRKQVLVFLVALAVLILALVFNLRRAGYAALGFIFLLMPLALYGRRKQSALFALLIAVLGIAYTVLFWDAQGLLGMPAEKIKSIFFAETHTTDHSSNFYRVVENVNLRRTIINNPLGIGFGHPFELYLPMVDISTLLMHWQYHPHNMILGMWMTLGTVGFMIFLFYQASVLALATRYIRNTPDHLLRAIGFFALATYAAGILVSSVDQFIWAERGAIFMALLVAMIAAIGRLSESRTQGHASANA